MPCREESPRLFIAPSFKPQTGLNLIELLRPYCLGSNRRSRSDGKKPLISSTSRTPAAGMKHYNKLTGRSGRFFCLCPISANSIAPQLMKNRTHKASVSNPGFSAVFYYQKPGFFSTTKPGYLKKTGIAIAFKY